MKRGTPGNVLTALVFTDIVGSTEVAEELGDRRWRELLSRHHRIVREGLREYGGRELDTAGDGVFARFDSPASAINFAAATADALRELGVEIRAAIHFGECEIFEGKLSGVNVHAAARTMALAGPGEILVTGSVHDLVRGAGFGFADRGIQELRGIDGEWRIFEVTSIDESHRSPPLPEGEARARRAEIERPALVKRRRVRWAAVSLVVLVVLAGAAFGLIHAVGGGASARALTGCEVTSNPPLHDRSFNQAVYDGLTAAATKWGISVEDKVSGTEATFKRNMRAFERQRCGLIVTFGTLVARDTAEAARANPTTNFATADAADAHGTSNLLSIQFEPQGAAFLAGYLAAGVTKTGKVATFGGIPIGTVVPFMDGFAAGVLYYNRVHGTYVRLLGWDPKKRTGTFVSEDPNNLGAFLDQTTPAQLTKAFIAKGADVVFPADGPNGEIGSCRAAQHANGVFLIGVDTDQHYATPDCVTQWLTSVRKIYSRMVYLAMGQVVEHRFAGGELKGTLENGGVGIAPFYNVAPRIPRPVRAELSRIKKGIDNRSIPLDPRAYLAG
jgi:basic membrane protein A